MFTALQVNSLLLSHLGTSKRVQEQFLILKFWFSFYKGNEFVFYSWSNIESYKQDWTLNIVKKFIFLNLCIHLYGNKYSYYTWVYVEKDLSSGSPVKNMPPKLAGDASLIPRLGRFPKEGNSSLLQYSSLENSMDKGICQATTYGLAESPTQLSD